ncbi:MAG: SH3 domain-containing protein, partial [Anaerolineae bacterium]|nr:SH3 domain-containing protein [Anaerolineae bacterium]
FRFAYEPDAAQVVSLQALGIDIAPVLAVLRDGQTVAADLNAAASPILNLDVFVEPGSYIVQVSAAAGRTGTVVMLVQGETPAQVAPLTAGDSVSGQVGAGTPVAIYSFSAQAEAQYLYVESGLADRGPSVRLTNDDSDQVSASLGADVPGGRFRIPVGTTSYTLELAHSGDAETVPYTVCLTTVSAASCETFTGLVGPIVTEEPVAICTVTPVGGAVNVRQSASVNAVILGALPAGVAAPVIGISPDGTFYFIEVNGVQGWVSFSVVANSGNCDVPFVSPPPITPQPSAPTATTLPFPTATPPTQPTAPAPVVTPEPSGPCLITITAPTYVYVTPNATQENLYDQTQAGYQLIPVGRLADNSWWHTNYGGAWIQTSTFGATATVSGDCSGLPVVSP